jgi:hypothetical protein
MDLVQIKTILVDYVAAAAAAAAAAGDVVVVVVVVVGDVGVVVCDVDCF